MSTEIPIIDISALVAGTSDKSEVAKQIGDACRKYGFFYIVGHGVDPSLLLKLETVSKQFFALPLEDKLKLKIEKGGIAWRGYFGIGNELTSGKPDMKEGVYFAKEMDEQNPIVKMKTPFHGRNFFSDDVPEFRQAILSYLENMITVGQKIMEGIALSLGLDEKYFYDRYTKDPLPRLSILRYPITQVKEDSLWGVGEHTDYGVLSILKQDNTGGLQIKSAGRWIDAPPVENSFVCNIGDMLDRMTGGVYRSTPHRVRCQTHNDRFSYPFFFDPNFFAEVKRIEGIEVQADDRDERWDKGSVHELSGTYGEYITRKYSKLFPDYSSNAS